MTIALLLICSLIAVSANVAEQKHTIFKVTVDGKLDEAIWRNAIVFDTFYQNGGRSDKAEVQSKAYIIADEDFIYGAVECLEPQIEAIVVKTKTDGNLNDVYRDESIEFMLDADKDPTSYYHFIINANGAHAQQFKLESGRISSVWKSENLWKSAAKKYDNKWVVEFAIPLSILSEEAKGICNNPNINFARNRHIGGIKESSILKNGTFHKGHEFIPVELPMIDPGKYFIRVGQKQLDVRQGDGGDLIVNVNTNLINNGERPMTGEINISFKNETGDTAGKKKEITLKAGELQDVSLPISLNTPGNYDMEITFAKNNDVIAIRQFPDEKIEFVPLIIVLDKPFYRNNFYHTEKADEILAIIKSNLSDLNGKTFMLKMLKGDEKIAGKSYLAKYGENTYKLPLGKDLPIGDYRFIVSIVDAKGEELANTSIEIKRLPKAPGTEVRVGKNLNILMDGKPYFPIYWSSDFYGDPANDANDGSTGRLIGWGGNAKEQLDRLHSRGLYGTYSIWNSIGIAKFVENKDILTEDHKKYLTKIVNVAKIHPNMYGYEILDEPGSTTGLKDGFLTKVRDYIAEMDPYHPAIITNNTAAGFFTYAGAQDISMPDPYPMFIEGGTSARGLDYQSYFLIEALKAGKGKTAIGICMQAFNYGDFTQKNGRAPSYVEFRSIFYNAAIHGAKIMYLWQYADDGARKYPQLKLGSPDLIEEVKALSMAIMLGELIFESPIVQEGVDHRILKYKGEYFIIATNSGSKTLPVGVKLPAGCNVTSLNTLSEGLVSVRGGVINDTIAPFASKIYTTSNSFGNLTKLKEIKSVIEKGGGVYECTY